MHLGELGFLNISIFEKRLQGKEKESLVTNPFITSDYQHILAKKLFGYELRKVWWSSNHILERSSATVYLCVHLNMTKKTTAPF